MCDAVTTWLVVETTIDCGNNYVRNINSLFSITATTQIPNAQVCFSSMNFFFDRWVRSSSTNAADGQKNKNKRTNKRKKTVDFLVNISKWSRKKRDDLYASSRTVAHVLLSTINWVPPQKVMNSWFLCRFWNCPQLGVPRLISRMTVRAHINMHVLKCTILIWLINFVLCCFSHKFREKLILSANECNNVFNRKTVLM